MLVAFDSSFLIPLFDSRWGDKGQLNPRIAHLISTLDRAKATIVVPTPALSELLIGARDAAPRYLRAISISGRFRVAPFDARAAVEAAAAHREAIDRKNKKEGSPSWDKVKYDRQILSIAIVEGASHLYSNDGDLKRISAGSPVEVLSLDDLPDPPFGAHEPEGKYRVVDLFDDKPDG